MPRRSRVDPHQLSFDDLPLEGARPLGNIYVGTCGWTDPTLLRSKAFYPPGVSTPTERLRYYADHFPLVEVDSTFYALPSAQNAWRWVQRTPPGFVFNIKAFSLLTRHRTRVRALPVEVRAQLPEKVRGSLFPSGLPAESRERIWWSFLNALKPLETAGKLGAVLFQFPPWFTATDPHRDYLRELVDRVPYRMAVEFRGGGWMDRSERARTLVLLEKLKLSYVMVDEPLGFKSSTPPVVAQTTPLAMVRLHGRNRETWEARNPSAAERFRYLYTEQELAPWVDSVRELADGSDQVHVLMNNCYEDHAVRNAGLFLGLLQGRGADEPRRDEASLEPASPSG